jgi:hypothetical protein
MIGTWEVRLFGRGPGGERLQRTYRFDGRDYCGACEAAKRAARAEGLVAPCVWAATRLSSSPPEPVRSL